MADANSIVSGNSTMARVQEIMNAVSDKGLWYGQSGRWRNLLVARNNFVRLIMENEGFTPQDYRDSDIIQKQYRVSQIATVFAARFFDYTRDNQWMQECVGDDGKWVYVHGMSAWHVRKALEALYQEDKKAKATTSTKSTATRTSISPVTQADIGQARSMHDGTSTYISPYTGISESGSSKVHQNEISQRIPADTTTISETDIRIDPIEHNLENQRDTSVELHGLESVQKYIKEN